jgi:hypothetical protein
MKRMLITTLIVILCASSMAFSAQATKSITVSPNTATVTVNGEKVASDNFNYNGTIYVPLRGVFEKAGFTVGWDQATKTAKITEPNDAKYTQYVVLLNEFKDIYYYNSCIDRVATNLKSNTLSTIKGFRDDLAQSQSDFIFENSETMYYSSDSYIKGTYEKACELYDTMLTLTDTVIDTKAKTGSFSNGFYGNLDSVYDDAIQYGDSVFSIYMAEINY